MPGLLIPMTRYAVKCTVCGEEFSVSQVDRALFERGGIYHYRCDNCFRHEYLGEFYGNEYILSTPDGEDSANENLSVLIGRASRLGTAVITHGADLVIAFEKGGPV